MTFDAKRKGRKFCHQKNSDILTICASKARPHRRHLQHAAGGDKTVGGTALKYNKKSVHRAQTFLCYFNVIDFLALSSNILVRIAATSLLFMLLSGEKVPSASLPVSIPAR